jgi:hypothetical protein
MGSDGLFDDTAVIDLFRNGARWRETPPLSVVGCEGKLAGDNT